jgi:hypothetical protein
MALPEVKKLSAFSLTIPTTTTASVDQSFTALKKVLFKKEL